jgi:hypothetical protein
MKMPSLSGCLREVLDLFASVSATSMADLTGSRSFAGRVRGGIREFGDYVSEPRAIVAWPDAAAARSDTKAWFAS